MYAAYTVCGSGMAILVSSFISTRIAYSRLKFLLSIGAPSWRLSDVAYLMVEP